MLTGRLAVGLSLLVAFAVASAPLHAGLINGDFTTEVPRNATGGGWTSSNLDHNGGWQSTGGNPGGNFVLNQAGQEATDPTISQVVSDLTIGIVYEISGEYEPFFPGFGDANALSFGVLVDGSAILELKRGPQDVYTPFSVTFTATSTSHTIAFAAERNKDDSSYRVDNLSLSAIPEPSTLVMFGSGLLGLTPFARRWWRRTSLSRLASRALSGRCRWS